MENTNGGEIFDSPKYYKTYQKKLRVIQHKVAKRKKGSIRRQKDVKLLAILTELDKETSINKLDSDISDAVNSLIEKIRFKTYGCNLVLDSISING